MSMTLGAQNVTGLGDSSWPPAFQGRGGRPSQNRWCLRPGRSWSGHSQRARPQYRRPHRWHRWSLQGSRWSLGTAPRDANHRYVRAESVTRCFSPVGDVHEAVPIDSGFKMIAPRAHPWRAPNLVATTSASKLHRVSQMCQQQASWKRACQQPVFTAIRSAPAPWSKVLASSSQELRPDTAGHT